MSKGMQPFEFVLPTKVVFGAGEISKTGREARAFGKKAMVVTYGEQIIKPLGFYDKLRQSCADAGVELIEFFGVKSNPTAEHANEGVRIAREQKPDVIIGLGGGSAMDSAKYIAVGALYDGDTWDFWAGRQQIEKALPVITVTTIPATSSEMNGT
jgi:alcohol dehydrogenase YqhD (iron-dependent ADH family)